MSRLIDADALRRWIEGECKSPSIPRNEAAFGKRILMHMEVMESEEAPTIEPERKTGKWILTEPDAPCFYRCDHCGRLLDFPECFCPTCGTDMRGEQNG